MRISDQLILAMSDNHDWETDHDGIKFARKLIALAQEVEPLVFVESVKLTDMFRPKTEFLAEHFEYYMGDNECRPLENARAAIKRARGE